MQKFISPKDVGSLCKALEQKDENTYVMAGGTDLIIHFNKNGIFDYNIINITKISELKKITENDSEIVIGACATMTDIENSKAVKKYIPALMDSAFNLGSQQIRNRATLGGNIANASQSGDNLPVLFAYDADVEIINSVGVKRIDKISNVIEGLGRNNLKPDEIITNIIIGKTAAKSAFSKVGSRKSVTISKINCCAKVYLDKNMTVENSSIFLGAIGPKPIRANLLEDKIINKDINSIDIEDLYDAVAAQVEKAIPNRASKNYKKSAARGLIEDVCEKLRSRIWNS